MIKINQSELPRHIIALSKQVQKFREKFKLDELAKRGKENQEKFENKINQANF